MNRWSARISADLNAGIRAESRLIHPKKIFCGVQSVIWGHESIFPLWL
jgi:hypothetical protein